MCSLDLEQCDLWSETPRTARKEHSCSACGGRINAREAYLSHVHVFDGHAYGEKMCSKCWWVRGVFADAHGQNCVPSALMEILRDCVGGDRDSEWRPLLADVIRRYRVSTHRWHWTRKRWAERAQRRQTERIG